MSDFIAPPRPLRRVSMFITGAPIPREHSHTRWPEVHLDPLGTDAGLAIALYLSGLTDRADRADAQPNCLVAARVNQADIGTLIHRPRPHHNLVVACLDPELGRRLRG